MANYTISQITLPNGDICYLKDANPVTELPSVTGANDGNVLIVENGEWTTGEVPVPETASDLPDVTTSDNGKVLMVVNGEWTTSDYPLSFQEIRAITDTGWNRAYAISYINERYGYIVRNYEEKTYNKYTNWAESFDTVYFVPPSGKLSYDSVTITNMSDGSAISYSTNVQSSTGVTVYSFDMPQSAVSISVTLDR